MHRNKPTPFREMLQFSANSSTQHFSSPEEALGNTEAHRK
jgi:hypothetical protein